MTKELIDRLRNDRLGVMRSLGDAAADAIEALQAQLTTEHLNCAMADEAVKKMAERVAELETACDLARTVANFLSAERDIIAAELAAALAQEPVEIDWPDYHHEAMGCGLEDRGIRDHYEAMQYGWDQAIEHLAERLPEKLFAAPIPPVREPLSDAFITLPRELDEDLYYTVGGAMGAQSPEQCGRADKLWVELVARSDSDAKRRAKPIPPEACTWTQTDDEDGIWSSSCGELWSFIDGGPKENRVSYCHHCGKKVEVKP